MQHTESADKRPTAISFHVAANIDRILAAVRAHLQMDVAFIAEFLGQNRIFHNVSGSEADRNLLLNREIPLTTGYCALIASGQLPELITDTGLNERAQSIPETHSIPIGSHISVPIRLERGRMFGTFCCYSHRPRPDLNERDLDLLRTFAAIVANELLADLKVSDERERKRGQLEEALERGDPQIVFQPIVRLTDQSLAGIEALSRFSAAPSQSPEQWFSDAHGLKMGVSLELLAVRKALSICADLPEPLVVNVNISPYTIVTADVASALSGFDPHRIVIEITEHVPIRDYAQLVARLAPLREAGMRIAIDDAGAGYSSLRHVLALRPDIVKFDTSLTRSIDADPFRKAMVAALSEFARRTGTTMVAEGVETEEELSVLRELKIEKGQGYLFGKPQPLSDLLRESARQQFVQFVSDNAISSTSSRKKVVWV